MLVQAEVGHHLLQPPILFFKLPKFAQVARQHSGVFLLPAIEGVLGDSHLPTHLRHGCSRLRLLQRVGNLRVGVGRLLHRSPCSASMNPTAHCDSTPVQFSGGRSPHEVVAVNVWTSTSVSSPTISRVLHRLEPDEGSRVREWQNRSSARNPAPCASFFGSYSRNSTRKFSSISGRAWRERTSSTGC